MLLERGWGCHRLWPGIKKRLRTEKTPTTKRHTTCISLKAKYFLKRNLGSTVLNLLIWFPCPDGQAEDFSLWFSPQGYFPPDRLIVCAVSPLCLAPLLWRRCFDDSQRLRQNLPSIKVCTQHTCTHSHTPTIFSTPATSCLLQRARCLLVPSSGRLPIQLRASGETCSSGSRDAAGAEVRRRAVGRGEELKVVEKLWTQETVSLNCLAMELFPRQSFSGGRVHTLEVSEYNSNELPESDFSPSRVVCVNANS